MAEGQWRKKWKQIDVWFKELLIGRDPVFQVHMEGRRKETW